MKLDSLSFVYFFLPLSVATFYLTPLRWKKPVLAVLTLVFYRMAAPQSWWFFLLNAGIDFILIQLMEKVDPVPLMRRTVLAMELGKCVLLFLNLGQKTGFQNALLPLGLMVIFLNTSGYFLQLYKRMVPYEHNPVDFFLFTSFFGTLACGPLAQYRELMPQLKELRPSLTSISKGIVMFTLGLAKKVLIADGLIRTYWSLRELGIQELSPLTVVATVLSLTLALFFYLSAYGDMGRGLGAIFSLEYPRNFYYPYQAKTMGECLERFNSTYSTFYQEQIAVFFTGKGRGLEGISSILYGIWMGLWFGLSPSYLIWGAMLGLVLFLEQGLCGKVFQKFPVLLRRACTFGGMFFACMVLCCHSLQEFFMFVQVMLGIGGAAEASAEAIYLLTANMGGLILGLFFSVSISDLVGVWARKHIPALSDGLAVLFNGALLIATTAFMIA